MIKKNFGFWRIFVLVLAGVLSCAGYAGAAGAKMKVSDLPPESAEPTPLEGTWAGVENSMGPVQTEYQFKGNTFLKRTINPNPGNVGGWWKGIFTYTDAKITLYTLQAYESNGIRNPQTGSVLYSWTNTSDYLTVITGQDKKYKLDSGALVFGKARFDKREAPIRLPEEYVFFQNDNNALTSNNPNPYAFTITAIDDRAARYVNMSFLGKGNAPIEIAEPETHKIAFRQKYRYLENDRRMESDVEGHFTRNFEPGIYSFSLYTPEHDAYMPKNLPPVPEEHTRIVIMKHEIGKSNKDWKGSVLYTYFDISTTNDYR
jgi:hypothetical protein